MDLFSNEKNTFSLPDAELIYYPNFLEQTKANIYFKTLLKETLWQQDDITVFGKTYKQPRLTALYAENNKPYSYSNINMHPKKFTNTLLSLKSKIEDVCNHNFSTVLLNLYRDGNDSNGWHADNEKELGKHPTIASLSLGASRVFKFKHKTLKKENHKLLLQHGSLLIMKGAMQEFWVHQIPKTKQHVGKRINLTFRYIN
ncbi:alpha-ketoglutarate-dependent dioxygenase AlkB family protein [Mangrovimonas spongiae]|uniref:Alpha-ketoglutarate-dependent dioxygenase AlkB n=1 Tax=Mangrovimonas spongiae TaxID=2494697 RepID=A0A428JYK9_9FLAO|nr:alpha-ketoglutarate-dependent dioxygenase AlkB [Mangrovimonas spongiae]RSK39217.1 alpha-ketoglutarate-dependent dioxygenase AlkB [Mangrovimonas spongiae]